MPLAASYGEEWGDGTARTQTDTGPGKVRLRFTATSDKLRVSYILTEDQVGILRTFYKMSVKMGSIAFDYTHPRNGETVSVRFARPPAISYVGGGLYRVQIELEVLP